MHTRRLPRVAVIPLEILFKTSPMKSSISAPIFSSPFLSSCTLNHVLSHALVVDERLLAKDRHFLPAWASPSILHVVECRGAGFVAQLWSMQKNAGWLIALNQPLERSVQQRPLRRDIHIARSRPLAGGFSRRLAILCSMHMTWLHVPSPYS